MYQTLFHGNLNTYEGDQNEISWEKKKIIIFDKSYNVFLAVIDNKTIIKPTEDKCRCPWTCCQNIEQHGYHQMEYEDLFGFGEHCQNFNQNKAIDITDKIGKSILIN